MKNLSNYIPLFVLFFLVSVIAFSTYKISKKQQFADTEIGKNFDSRFAKEKIILAEFSLPDLFDENGNFSNQDLKGKYSLINLFASWCTTCRAEHDVLMRLKSKNIIDIYGVAWRDINQNTRSYLAESGNPFKKVAADNQALFTKLVGINAVPETLLIDPQGQVVLRYVGNLEEYAEQEIEKFMQDQNGKKN